jgi:hypothetical protein
MAAADLGRMLLGSAPAMDTHTQGEVYDGAHESIDKRQSGLGQALGHISNEPRKQRHLPAQLPCFEMGALPLNFPTLWKHNRNIFWSSGVKPISRLGCLLTNIRQVWSLNMAEFANGLCRSYILAVDEVVDNALDDGNG